MGLSKNLSTRRQWRKWIKKQQRKRKRQIQARERDKQLKLEYLEKLKDPIQMELEQKQRELDEIQERIEYEKKCDEEEAWLRRELIAQREFKRAQRAALSKKMDNSIVCQNQRKEDIQKIPKREKDNETCTKEFEVLMQLMDAYITNMNMRTPPQFHTHVESHPDNRMCEFFDKTNCCRFGYACRFNHKRPILSRCIIIKNFFQHPLLNAELHNHKEYRSGDDYLESDNDDLRKSYEEFCEDVWPELEKFGNIITFRVTRNTQKHLRGHAFVEYEHKRESLKAFINLHGRYYASKCLNVEFSNIKNWRSAVCGMSLKQNCPKGELCNYLHFFTNPKHKYEKSLKNTIQMSGNRGNVAKQTFSTPLLSWSTIDNNKNENVGKDKTWRWSESPEVDIKEGKAHLQSTTTSKSDSRDNKKAGEKKQKKSSKKRKSSRRKHSKRKRKRKYDDTKPPK